MREKKWVPNIYQPDDEAAIVKRLEKLAAKGWFLERADNWGWTLRRGKPAQVRYAVTYFPGASVFDPGPTEDQETYADYCRAAGWEFVSSYGPVQYFRSDLPDPAPIETDEGAKLEAIHRTKTKNTLLASGLVLVVLAIFWSGQLRVLRQTPLSVLSDNVRLAILAVFLILSLCAVIAPVDYLIWYFRSKRSVENGGACLPSRTWLRSAANILLLSCPAALLGVVLAAAGSVRRIALFLVLLALQFLPYAALWTVFLLLRRRGRDRDAVRKGYIIAAVIAGIGSIALQNTIQDSEAFSGLLTAPARQPEQIYVDSDGDSHNLYADDLPVTLEDLGIQVTASDHCSYERNHSASPLVSYTTYEQRAASEESDLPWLLYGVADFAWEGLAKEQMERMVYGGPVVMGGQIFILRESNAVEDPRWGADQTYYKPRTTGKRNGGEWLLRYGNRLVGIRQVGWELTDERVEILREALSGQ